VHVMYRGSVRIYKLLKLDADTIVTGEFDDS
jgi:lipopolysaccharide biosynthesis glycosyltransferase